MKTLLSLVLILGFTHAQGKTQRADDKVLTDTYSEASKKREDIATEAVEALEKTQDALTALDKKNKKEALEDLRNAIGRFEILKSKNKSLSLAPVAVSVEKSELQANAEEVRDARLLAREALESNRVQRAREILTDLKSEIKITVTNLPLKNYPPALKEAVSQIESNDIESAKSTLANALSTVTLEEIVYPIPLAKAEYFIEQAEASAIRKKPVDDEAVKVFAKAAKEELRLAKALGYTMETSFDPLYAKLDELLKNPLKGIAFYEDLKEEFNEIVPRTTVTRQAQEAE